jgi:hypothetical protein
MDCGDFISVASLDRVTYSKRRIDSDFLVSVGFARIDQRVFISHLVFFLLCGFDGRFVNVGTVTGAGGRCPVGNNSICTSGYLRAVDD